MSEQNSSATTTPTDRSGGRAAGSVRVTRAGSPPNRWRTVGRYAILAVVMVATSAAVLFGSRLVLAGHAAEPAAPATLLVGAPAAGRIPGSARLSLSEPRVVLASRLAPAAEVAVPLDGVPRDTTAVLLEVSIVDAAGPGAVTLTSAGGQLTALHLPAPGTQLTATVVVPVGTDRALRVATAGGGQLIVNLIGAFEPAGSSGAGRIIPVTPTPVLRLVPDKDGHDADIDPYQVPAVRAAGSVSAVLLDVSADVGPNGGLVSTGPSAAVQNQTAFWSATSDADRTRTALLVVPVSGDRFHLHYKAGSVLDAAVVGYVTDTTAAADPAGLVVPVMPGPDQPVAVPIGSGVTVTVVPPEGLHGVPAERVVAALVGVAATGDATGGVSVRAPGPVTSPGPTLVVEPGPARSATVLVPVVNGRIQVDSEAGASVIIAPQLLILTG
jgi:hypothetical protein